MQVAIDYLSESVFWPVTLLVVPPWSFVWWVVIGVLLWAVNRLRYPWCRDASKMHGKTVIITGANKGEILSFFHSFMFLFIYLFVTVIKCWISEVSVMMRF